MYVDVVDVVDIDTNVLYVYRNVDIVDICRYSIEVDTISVSGYTLYTVLSRDSAPPPAISVPVPPPVCPYKEISSALSPSYHCSLLSPVCGWVTALLSPGPCASCAPLSPADLTQPPQHTHIPLQIDTRTIVTLRGNQLTCFLGNY